MAKRRYDKAQALARARQAALRALNPSLFDRYTSAVNKADSLWHEARKSEEAHKRGEAKRLYEQSEKVYKTVAPLRDQLLAYLPGGNRDTDEPGYEEGEAA